jgi:1,4-dihydroxy-2-naphthoate octaprenyltransferase
MILVPVSIHYANEYADYQTDALKNRTLYSRGGDVLQSGSVLRKVSLQAALITQFLAIGIDLIATFLSMH